MSEQRAWETEGVALLERANNAWRVGKVHEAEKLYGEVVDQYPDRPEGYNKVGVIHAEMGRPRDAEQWFAQALVADPHFVPALTNLGNILLERGETDKAILQYTLALRIDPEYAPAYKNMGVALKRQGHVTEAVKHWKHGDRLSQRTERTDARRRLFGGKASAAKPKASGAGFLGGNNNWIWAVVLVAAALYLLKYIHR